MSIKKAGSIGAVAVVSLAAGWVLHGVLGGSGAPGGMPGMGPMEMPPPAVVVQELKEQSVLPVAEYIAQVEAVQAVAVRAEIAGSIRDVHVKEGALVEEGEALFTINPAPFEAAAGVREAELTQARAEVDRARKYFDRLSKSDARSVSPMDLDAAESDFLGAQARVQQAEANLNLARIDLGYTDIRSPIAGRIGAIDMTKGNYVSPASGELAHIVQTDPIRVVFSMTDREFLSFKSREAAGVALTRAATIRLPEGTVLPAVGVKDFEDNRMNPETGTIAVRYRFDNSDGRLVPGGYVTALIRNSDDVTGIRVPQKSVLVDADGAYVLTVNDDGLVSAVRIETGVQIETDVVVASGLRAGDRVITEGLQKAHPGGMVQVTMQDGGQ